jgi:hypothetical protein
LKSSEEQSESQQQLTSQAPSIKLQVQKCLGSNWVRLNSKPSGIKSSSLGVLAVVLIQGNFFHLIHCRDLVLKKTY